MTATSAVTAVAAKRVIRRMIFLLSTRRRGQRMKPNIHGAAGVAAFARARESRLHFVGDGGTFNSVTFK